MSSNKKYFVFTDMNFEYEVYSSLGEAKKRLEQMMREDLTEIEDEPTYTGVAVKGYIFCKPEVLLEGSFEFKIKEK